MTFDATVSILQAVATYLALGSSYYFARPFLRSQEDRESLQLLENASSDDPIEDAVRRASAAVFRDRLQRRLPQDRRANYIGISLLAGSFVVFSIAIALQNWRPR